MNIPPKTVQATRPFSEAQITGFILVIAATLYLWFIWRTRFTLNGLIAFSLFDDAMISMRYARNLAEGYGLNWNPGEAPVEGYTNLFWTLWMAVIHWAGISDRLSSLIVMLSGTGILVLNAYVVARCAKLLFPAKPWAGHAAAVMAAFYYPLVFWTLRGMEVGLLTLVIDVGIFYCLRLSRGHAANDLTRLGGIVALLPLIRDDASIPALILIVYAVWQAPAEFRKSSVFWLVGCLSSAILVHAFARKFYYGDWLPNTYYLKVGGLPLNERLQRGLYAFYELNKFHLWPLTLPFLAALWKSAENSHATERKLLWLPATLVLGQVAYSIFVGGDAWEWLRYTNRYLCITLPALLLVSIKGTEDLMELFQRREFQLKLLFSAFALGVLFSLSHWWFGWPGIAPAYCSWAVTGFAAVLWAGSGFLRKYLFQPANILRLVFAFFLVANYAAYREWIDSRGSHVAQDAEMAELGWRIRQCTSDSASFATLWAGAPSYFSRRHTIDLLGKSDRVISHLSPRNNFVGHNKWDLRHSVRDLKPDLVVLRAGYPLPQVEVDEMVGWGYQPIAFQIFARGRSLATRCF